MQPYVSINKNNYVVPKKVVIQRYMPENITYLSAKIGAILNEKEYRFYN